MTNVKIFVSVIVVLVLGTVATVLLQSGSGSAPTGPGKLDTFAQCLNDKGATFYGAFWCPHCKAQKALFGASVKLLKYVECSLPDASGQTQICKDNKIDGYPTWIFADGSRKSGEIPLADLAAKTNCALPTDNATTAK